MEYMYLQVGQYLVIYVAVCRLEVLNHFIQVPRSEISEPFNIRGSEISEPFYSSGSEISEPFGSEILEPFHINNP